MKKRLTCIMGYLLLCTSLILINGCVSYTPQSIAPHINLSPENMQLAPDSDQSLDFGMEVESNESDTLENLEVLPGVRIRSVRPASAADNAGLKRSDIILSINNIKTNHPDMLATIAETSKAKEFVFVVRRDTTVFETTMVAPKAIKSVTPKERYRADPLKTRAGYRTEIIKLHSNSTKKSVVARIVQLWPDSPFIKAGIEVGDAITSINNTSFESAQDLINRLSHDYKYGQRVTFTILEKDTTSKPKLSDKDIVLWDPGRKVSKFNIWPLFMYKSKGNPSKTKFSFIDVWFFSLFSYERDESERSYSLLKFIRFQSDNRGELIDKTNATGQNK